MPARHSGTLLSKLQTNHSALLALWAPLCTMILLKKRLLLHFTAQSSMRSSCICSSSNVCVSVCVLRVAPGKTFNPLLSLPPHTTPGQPISHSAELHLNIFVLFYFYISFVGQFLCCSFNARLDIILSFCNSAEPSPAFVTGATSRAGGWVDGGVARGRVV